MSVRVATTANITLTHATTVVDGVTLANGDIILVKNQTTGTQNGVYVVSTSGAWARSSVMAVGSNAYNVVIFVISGTLNSGESFQCTSNPAVVGTNTLLFWLYNNNFQLFWAGPANGNPTSGQEINGVIGGNASYNTADVSIRLTPASNNQTGYVNWNVAGFDFTRDFQFNFCIYQGAGADGIQIGVGGSSAFTGVGTVNGGLGFSYNTYSVTASNDQFYINGSAVGNLVAFHFGVTYTGEWMTCILTVRTVGTKKVAYLITGSSNSLDNSYDVSNWVPGGTYVGVMARTGATNAEHFVNSVTLQYL